VAIGSPRFINELIVFSAWNSVAAPIAAFSTMTAEITIASAIPPVAAEIAAEPASISTGRLLNWSRKMAAAERAGARVIALAP
jgi:hypothetical protein